MSINFAVSSPLYFFEDASQTEPLTLQSTGVLRNAQGTTVHSYEFEMVSGFTDTGLYINHFTFNRTEEYRYACAACPYQPSPQITYLGSSTATAEERRHGPWGIRVSDASALTTARYDSSPGRLYINGAQSEKVYIIYGLDTTSTTFMGEEYLPVTQLFLLTVRDTEMAAAPAVQFYNSSGSLTSPIRISRGGAVPAYTAVAFDSIDGFIPITSSGTVNNQLAGTYPIVWTSEANSAGKSTTSTMTILVENSDTTPPVISLVGGNPLVVNTGGALPSIEAIAVDAVDGNCPVSASGTVDLTTPGDYTRTYTARDTSENEAVPVSRTVRVVDTAKPVITFSSGPVQLVTQNTTYSPPTVTATDLADGDLSESLVATGTVDTTTLGTYEVVYSVSDSSGNEATATLIVRVVPSDTISWTDTNAEEGTWWYRAVVRETVTGNEELAATNVCTVTVPEAESVPVDRAAPVLTLVGPATVTIQAGQSWQDPGVIAWDALDGYLNDYVSVTGTVDSQTCGVYSLFYSVSNTSGIIRTVTRTVQVIDTHLPVISLLGDNPLYLLQGDTFSDPGAAAVDACDGALTVVTSNCVDTSQVGTYVNTYTASDSSGNTATAERVVHVISNRCTFVANADLTINQKYWFRGVIVPSDENSAPVTTNSDAAWLSQPPEFTAVTPTTYALSHQGNARFLARLEVGGGLNRRPVTPSEVTSIQYTIFRKSAFLWEQDEAVTRHTNVVVPVFPWILEEPVVDYGWDVDTTGYNFIHVPDRSIANPFPTPGQYKVCYTIALNSGSNMELVWHVETED
ncbi:MAG: DUF5011 domain-containing protein [Planctomycetia bacterium]|nr:DUF5011 domain-containing protein [Planctomycetia bacterium]